MRTCQTDHSINTVEVNNRKLFRETYRLLNTHKYNNLWANIEIWIVKALGPATTFHLTYLMLVWWWTPVEFLKLTDNGVAMNGEDGWI